MRNDEYRVRCFQNLQYSNERKGRCKALAFWLVIIDNIGETVPIQALRWYRFADIIKKYLERIHFFTIFDLEIRSKIGCISEKSK